VMHACGHDVHMTSLLGTAGVLAANRDAWSGKLMIVAQPAEELGEGARRMMQDGLFRRFGRPDYTLALHVEPSVESGKVAVVPGWAAANVDAVDITVHGRGGHGARPHVASDPIVASAELVMALQTLVSRRVDPQDPAVVTVGSIHGGTKYNVIPDSVHLQLTVRSYSDAVRSTLLDGIAQIARDVCSVHRCERPPDVKVKQDYTPAVYNDPELARAAVAVFEQALGQDAVVEIPPTMGGEDFGRFARELKVPGLLFRLGATPRAALVRSRAKGASPVPTLHSSRFAPDAKRAIPTGVRATASLALALLARPE
jgi:amidohydrolase